jgi:hypothetical protein
VYGRLNSFGRPARRHLRLKERTMGEMVTIPAAEY